jgi:hypothetical protein
MHVICEAESDVGGLESVHDLHEWCCTGWIVVQLTNKYNIIAPCMDINTNYYCGPIGLLHAVVVSRIGFYLTDYMHVQAI